MARTATKELDQTKSEAFAEKMLGILNNAGLSLMTAIGHRTGLFDAMADMAPATSDEIASNSGLNERYVREWLGAMVTGRIVEYDPTARTYMLPGEHAAWLTRESTPDNIATTTQWISVLAGVEDDIVKSFSAGGGVPYEKFHRFHEVMAEESGQTVLAGLLNDILPLVCGARERLEQGIDVLDIGCGAGRAMCLLAETFPASRFAGFDLCDEAISAACAEAQHRNVDNVRFETKDITALGEPASYDLITAFDVIHDQKNPAAVLREIHEALRPGGTFLMQDIAASSHLEKNLDHVLGPFLYTISTMHCMTVSLAQGGAGLGTVWGEELAVNMLGDAGFSNIQVKRLPHDILNSYYLARKA